MILKVSVVRKDGVWSLWQGPRGESQWRPLGFWGKALLSSINKGFFERLLLACYWVLVEMTMYYQVITSLEQLIIAWALPTKSWSWTCKAAIHHQLKVVFMWLSPSRAKVTRSCPNADGSYSCNNAFSPQVWPHEVCSVTGWPRRTRVHEEYSKGKSL